MRADVVARFQGGHNAGHALVINGEVYKLSLLPSGIVREGKLSVIGNGVVVDPWALLEEIDTLRAQGVAISPDNLKIAHNATLILPLHQELDAAREGANSGVKIGTTKRGIGPARRQGWPACVARCRSGRPDTLADKMTTSCATIMRCAAGSTTASRRPARKTQTVAPEITPYAALFSGC